ncbi:MAG: glycine cleavage system aminomethyltransferase GcvT [bacterium]|nr:glycine cleavage system aminomethyltransferase GcvT [bacterium]
MKQTSLHDVHAALGAKLVDFAGWHMPVQYGPILDEVRCVRERVGLFDLGHMGRVWVSGPDALAFVDHVVTCYTAKIPLGSIRYGLLCRENGSPIDDLLVYRQEDGIFLVVNASNTDEDLAWMRAHTAGFDVTIEDQTIELAMLALQGQASAAVLSKLTDYDLAGLGYYKFAFGTVCGLPDVRISRTGYTGEDGFEVYFPDGESERVWNELLAAGESEGLAPIGLGARDTLRLEAGMALFGHEIDAEHNPIEAGLNFAVSFKEEKGDWIGREPLLRVKENPRRKLIGITTDGKRVPRQGYELYKDDQAIGRVCSGAVSPTIGKNIGSAYLPVDLAVAGESVDLDIRGKRQACTVVDLPFYSRTRK